MKVLLVLALACVLTLTLPPNPNPIPDCADRSSSPMYYTLLPTKKEVPTTPDKPKPKLATDFTAESAREFIRRRKWDAFDEKAWIQREKDRNVIRILKEIGNVARNYGRTDLYYPEKGIFGFVEKYGLKMDQLEYVGNILKTKGFQVKYERTEFDEIGYYHNCTHKEEASNPRYFLHISWSK